MVSRDEPARNGSADLVAFRPWRAKGVVDYLHDWGVRGWDSESRSHWGGFDLCFPQGLDRGHGILKDYAERRSAGALPELVFDHPGQTLLAEGLGIRLSLPSRYPALDVATADGEVRAFSSAELARLFRTYPAEQRKGALVYASRNGWTGYLHLFTGTAVEMSNPAVSRYLEAHPTRELEPSTGGGDLHKKSAENPT